MSELAHSIASTPTSTPGPAPVPATAEQFDTMEHQAHAARLGMWVFLASEILLFAGFFALIAAQRVLHPAATREAVHANTKVLGSINTFVLLTSSTLVAAAVHAFRDRKRRATARLVFGTVALGALFLVLKMTEYAHHFDEGIFPGGKGQWFVTHSEPGLAPFWTLYFIATGLHAVHITVGMIFLATVGTQITRGTLPFAQIHRLELAAVYWHLVDVVWIFLWPLFYLA